MPLNRIDGDEDTRSPPPPYSVYDPCPLPRGAEQDRSGFLSWCDRFLSENTLSHGEWAVCYTGPCSGFTIFQYHHRSGVYIGYSYQRAATRPQYYIDCSLQLPSYNQFKSEEVLTRALKYFLEHRYLEKCACAFREWVFLGALEQEATYERFVTPYGPPRGYYSIPHFSTERLGTATEMKCGSTLWKRIKYRAVMSEVYFWLRKHRDHCSCVGHFEGSLPLGGQGG